jgi:hypothetical protein
MMASVVLEVGTWWFLRGYNSSESFLRYKILHGKEKTIAYLFKSIDYLLSPASMPKKRLRGKAEPMGKREDS